MKTLLFFITHCTLTHEHCELSLLTLRNQEETTFTFDTMYIYNTHDEELPNSWILEQCEKLDIYKFVKEIRIFCYDKSSHKSLGQDVTNIIQYVSANYTLNDRVLFMKSDCLLSKYYLRDIEDLPPDRPVNFTAPFICAKKRVSNEEILQYTQRSYFVRSDEITFFTEDRYRSDNNDFVCRPEMKITNEQIKFFSCYVIRDWSCHLISVELFSLIGIVNQSWGGIGLQRLESYLCETDRSFVVHKYHGVVSENRDNERWGPVNEWLNS